MQAVPDEIHIIIMNYLQPHHMHAVNKRFNKIAKCNVIWGPIVYSKYGIKKSNKFFEEFKWMKRVQRHRLDYKRRWTLGCVGKFQSLPQKPPCESAYTKWEPGPQTCST